MEVEATTAAQNPAPATLLNPAPATLLELDNGDSGTQTDDYKASLTDVGLAAAVSAGTDPAFACVIACIGIIVGMR